MTIDIAFSLNRALAQPLTVVINSILKNTAQPAALRFNILIPPGETPLFQTQIDEAFPQSPAQFRIKEYLPPEYIRDYLDAKFKFKDPQRRLSRYLQYSRLFLKDALPDVSRVIYLDVDIIVLVDIKALFDQGAQFNSTQYFAAVPQFFPSPLYFSNPFKMMDEIRQFKQTFNGGVFMTDVSFWTDETYNRLKYYLDLDKQANYRLYNLGDEPIVNLMFKRDYLPLDKKWNCCGYGDMHLVTFFLRKDPSQMNVIHWSGGHHKPWQSKNIIYGKLWESYRP